MVRRTGHWLGLLLFAALAACVDSGAREQTANAQSESCMLCHNGSNKDDYAGPGMENPHPFTGADNLSCTDCHGGNPQGTDKDSSHVPPPPEIGDRENWERDRRAYFNRLTLTGIDKLPNYTVDGVTYTGIDYLQFVNPSDLRVVGEGRSCGQCHDPHVQNVIKSPLATETGVFSGAMYAIGVENKVEESRGLYQDTAADMGFRAVTDTAFTPSAVGQVARLLEFPVYSRRDNDANSIDDNRELYRADQLPQYQRADGTVVSDSPLAHLYHEQIAFTCGDCHLGSAGANNRYGDFRGSGCSSCHMPKSLSGRATHSDPNMNREEPRDVDDIDEPELPHVRRHLIISKAQTLPSGEFVEGIDDYACAGCHQGSNRTVMQYWGIRLDQNQDLRRRVQYPLQPDSFRNTRNDTRLFDPVIRNRTFNGRNENQYILEEDYDGDDRDDTPPDVHYEAGMGCIDCHGSYDLHGGAPSQPGTEKINSRMNQSVAIRCESCHGTTEAYATTENGRAYDGTQRLIGKDDHGNALPHLYRDGDDFYMISKLTGRRHYVPQTRDTIVDNEKINPFTQRPVFSLKASYAMGRNDGNANTGMGPVQDVAADPTGFKHGDNMDCASCHAAWTNTCMGCHLEGEFNRNNNFSNITGENIVFRERNADFVYQSPIFFQLGVNSRNKITQTAANTKVFFQWRDDRGNFSKTFAFTDRNGNGNNPSAANPHPSLGHNAMLAHSIRGRVTPPDTEGPKMEGPRYCVACHLTTEGLDNYGDLYNQLRTSLATQQYDQMPPFETLAQHFGANTGNAMNSPLFVHMVAGLGTGLFLFDEDGCPINPLDEDDDRKGCDDAPADVFDPETWTERVRYNLDRVVDANGRPTGSSNHALLEPGDGTVRLRQGSNQEDMSGPLGFDIIDRLTNPTPGVGIILTGWLDANGDPHGTAVGLVTPPSANASADTEKDDEPEEKEPVNEKAARTDRTERDEK